jgi:exopolyphosphatase/guanosine-5'-triphosphate,3'-diphosphate pyrophosphatase
LPLLAAIDIGTHTHQLLVAEVTSAHALKRLHLEKRMTRLGEGFSLKRSIRAEAAGRSIAALLHFRSVLDAFQIDDLSVVATSAVREADNQADFLAQVKRQVGFDVAVLSGDEEAYRTFLGVNLVIGNRSGEMTVIDIGGGSTELALARGEKPAWAVSLPLGVTRLAETYLSEEIPSASALGRMRHEIDQTLEAVPGITERLSNRPGKKCRFAGTAGTITTLAAIEQQMTDYQPERVNRYPVSRACVTQRLWQISAMKRSERKTIPGLESGREDILISGSLILLSVMEHFGYDVVEASDCGLREGTLLWQFQERFSPKSL